MDKRQALILERSIRDYIQTGKPITSGHLYRRHRFGIKPAMIRRELNALSDADYFSQVHHSGGRVPTLKAYRFFVEQLKHEAFGEAPFMSDVFSFMQKGALQELVAFLAEELRLVSVIYDPEEDALYRSGLEALCASQDIFGKDMLLSVIRDIELLPERLRAERSFWNAEEENWPAVFIGKNQFTDSDALSVAAGRGKKYRYLAVGPVRMNYRTVLNLLQSLESYG